MPNIFGRALIGLASRKLCKTFGCTALGVIKLLINCNLETKIANNLDDLPWALSTSPLE